jgi:HD-GYP domain-containing protein (c-di-GMP phosphodiesterase class II)
MGPLYVLSAEIERRDPYTLGHSTRVTAIAQAIAERLECDGQELEALALGGPLHDIGKLTISSDVLLKPGRLDDHELREIREHPAAGAKLIRGFRALEAALPCVLYHHERWDGEGYPERLSGTAVPRPARILAVADAFDAMTTTRPYREALPVCAAVAEVGRCAGSQFDPDVTGAFLAAWDVGAVEAVVA